jgi:hypothetical protein
MNLDARRAVEALRAGVPNREAVRSLGSGQASVNTRFIAALSALESNAGDDPAARGFIVEGEFGSGKSHVLRALREEALRRNFATSLITVSKETPLSDLDSVYKAAIKELALPDRHGGELDEVVLRLDPKTSAYADFSRAIAEDEELNVDPIFAATLFLSERLTPDDPTLNAIQAFWAGARISLSLIRKELRYHHEAAFTLKPHKNADLAAMRFIFAAGLMRAAGYKGWILLLDEVELIVKFPLRGRARAYANLAWLLGNGEGPIPGLHTVAATTQDFTGEIFSHKQDDTKIPLSLSERDPRLTTLAIHALQLIRNDDALREPLLAPGAADLDRVHQEVREIYHRAFGWQSREAARPPYTGVRRSMRMHMREWITRWDLARLDPSYSAQIITEALRPDLSEERNLEGFSEKDILEDPLTA